MATYTDVSVTRAKALARKARQFGYSYSFDTRHAWVRCPECHHDVQAESVFPRGNDMGPVVRALDVEMVAHLTMGDCATHRG